MRNTAAMKMQSKLVGNAYSYDIKDNEFYAGVYEVERHIHKQTI